MALLWMADAAAPLYPVTGEDAEAMIADRENIKPEVLDCAPKIYNQAHDSIGPNCSIQVGFLKRDSRNFRNSRTDCGCGRAFL